MNAIAGGRTGDGTGIGTVAWASRFRASTGR